MSLLNSKGLLPVAMLTLLGVPGLVQAQMQKELHEEYSKQIKTAETIGALGNDLFGEQVNFYTGSTSFAVTDVSLRGNSALPVEVRRSFKVESRDGLLSPGLFGDWELDIPYLYGTFARQTASAEVGWKVNTLTPNARCAVNVNNAMPPKMEASGSGVGNYFEAEEYWAGNSLHLPAGGDQEMLAVVPENPNLPTTGGPYYWVTSGNWVFSCLTSTANGVNGEAFLARGPDGTTYRFDYPVKRTAPSMMRRIYSATSERGTGGAQQDEDIIVQPRVAQELILNRQDVRILPTLVTDRFGNTVTYTYDATVKGRLNSISSSDGRLISLTYNAGGQIATVTADGRTWTYTYLTDTTGTALTTVTLPDASQWSYSLASLRGAFVTYVPDTTTCEVAGDIGGAIGGGTMTHPSGAVGTFEFDWVRHGRSYVPNSCVRGGAGGRVQYSMIPQTFDVPSLISKQITGPGIPTAMWTYQYSAAAGSWLENCPAPTSCARTKTVTIIGPGDWQRLTFGTKVFEDEGKLLKTETGNSASDILRVQNTTYQTTVSGQIYPALLGRSPNMRGDAMSQYLMPETKRVTTQQGRTFTWDVPATCAPNGATGTQWCFDRFGRPTKVVKSSAPTP